MAETKASVPPVRACLFDMDGLLIDSEDIYTTVTNKVLKEFGRPNLPWSIKAQLQGRPGPESYEILATWAALPCTKEEYMSKQGALQRELFPTTQPLPGVPQLLSTLASCGIHLALATSSHAVNYRLKTSHLEPLFSAFPDSQKVLGDDPRIPKGKGKPAPDIYFLALKTINENLRAKGEREVTPQECLVFEDSVPGAEAGRRAGMQVVWCPHPELLKEFKGKEEEVLAGTTNVGTERDPLAVDDGVGVEAEKASAGWPGKKGDGWGVLVHSLEDFEYGRWGIEAKE